MVLLTFTRKPSDSNDVFQAESLFLRSLRESLKITRSSAFSNSHRELTLDSLDKASIMIMDNEGLSKGP